MSKIIAANCVFKLPESLKYKFIVIFIRYMADCRNAWMPSLMSTIFSSGWKHFGADSLTNISSRHELKSRNVLSQNHIISLGDYTFRIKDSIMYKKYDKGKK